MSMICSFSISTNLAHFLTFFPYTSFFTLFFLFAHLKTFLTISWVFLMTIARFLQSVFIIPCVWFCIPHYYLQITNISSYTEYLLF